MNRVATLATAEKEKAIGEHTSIIQMPPERNEPGCLGGGTVGAAAGGGGGLTLSYLGLGTSA